MQVKKYDAQSVIASYLSGKSLSEVSILHGIGHETVRNVLIRHGVNRRNATPAPKNIGPTKICSMCQEEKPRGEFYGQGVSTSFCKSCDNLRKRVEYAEGKTSYRLKHLSQNSLEREVTRKKSRYHVKYSREKHSKWPPEQFDAAWESQGGLCAICERPMTLGGVRSDSVCADHDHTTGKPRSLLCAKCNKHLGIYEKNKHLFEVYLGRWS